MLYYVGHLLPWRCNASFLPSEGGGLIKYSILHPKTDILLVQTKPKSATRWHSDNFGSWSRPSDSVFCLKVVYLNSSIVGVDVLWIICYGVGVRRRAWRSRPSRTRQPTGRTDNTRQPYRWRMFLFFASSTLSLSCQVDRVQVITPTLSCRGYHVKDIMPSQGCSCGVLSWRLYNINLVVGLARRDLTLWL